MRTRKRGCARSVLAVLAGLSALCLVLAAVSAIANQARPAHSTTVERLSEADRARLAEAFHLRETLGESVLPGWAEADIPVILYNEENLFLAGLPNPEPGWVTVPKGQQMGAAWEPLSAGASTGQVIYRQGVPAPGQNTQAFTVKVGDRWVASLSTWEWTRIVMASELREALPAPLQPIAPYGILVNLFLPGSDTYVSLILHESVHAYQGMRAPERLADAENIYNTHRQSYPYDDEPFAGAWQAELDLLYRAVQAENDEDSARLAGEFLAQRAQRRNTAGLPDTLVDLERLKEWEEGIAKYVELTIAVQAQQSPHYQPLPALSQDPDFHGYQNAQRKWGQEIDQIRREANAGGDGRFYYSGLAQAVLLDRLAPGWKERLFAEDTWLEDLLAEALAVVPEAKSPQVGRFVRQDDGDYAYTMLRPAGWKTVEDHNRTYMPFNAGSPPELSITAMNLVIFDREEFRNVYVEPWNLFQEHPRLEEWTKALERAWVDTGAIENIHLIQTLEQAKIYSIRGGDRILRITAFVVDQDQPLLVVLDANGDLADLARLQQEGIYDDYRTMVESIRAAPRRPGVASPAFVE